MINSAKAGRVVPVKVTIYDVCAQAPYTEPTAPTIAFGKTSSPTSTDVDQVERYADTGMSSAGTKAFRMADGFWIYNLDTSKTLTVGQTYRVDVWVGGVKASDDEHALLKAVK